MADEEEKWTKWWWLSYFGIDETWSAEERNVRIALGMSTLPIILIIYCISIALLGWFGIEQHVAALLAGAMSIIPGFLAARPIAAMLYSDYLRKADENSKKRLDGSSLHSN
jgi:hypothetical protein